MTVNAQTVVQLALAQVGDHYVFGTEVAASDPNPSAFDCSELVEWACARAGVTPTMPDGTWLQQAHCQRNGTMVSVEQGVGTRGALLFNHRDANGNPVTDLSTCPPHAHVAFSLGDGTTMEAMGTDYGVRVGSARGRNWTHAALIPGVDHGSKEPPPPRPVPTPAPTPAPTLAPTPGPPKIWLKQGSTGAPVKELQARLEAFGVDRLPHHSTSGTFTPLTDLAIRLVQQHVQATFDPNMVVDGDCGPVTWGWVSFLASAAPGLAPPAGGPPRRPDLAAVKDGVPGGAAVSALQQALVALGITRIPQLRVTGEFGPLTDLGVKLFQWHVRTNYDSTVDVDGICGPVTWSWLTKLTAAP